MRKRSYTRLQNILPANPYPQLRPQPRHRASEPTLNIPRTQYDTNHLQFASLPSDQLPSTNEGPYPSVTRPSITASTNYRENPPGSSRQRSNARILAQANQDLLLPATPKKKGYVIPKGRYRFHTQTLEWRVGEYSRNAPNEPYVPLANYAPHPYLLPFRTKIESLRRYPLTDLNSVVKNLNHELQRQGKRIQDYLNVESIVSKRYWDVDSAKDEKWKPEDRKQCGSFQSGYYGPYC